MDPAPDSIEATVLGPGAKGTPKCLLISTTHTNYMFNCGEGTQRIAAQLKAKLSKVEHILITHRSWENIGGLVGMALTLGSYEVPKVTVHGPKGIERLLRKSKEYNDERTTFVALRNTHVESEFSDNCFSIDYVKLHKRKLQVIDSSSAEKIIGADEKMVASEVLPVEEEIHKSDGENSDTDLQPQGSSKRRRLDQCVEREEICVVYICRPKPRRRKVDKSKLSKFRFARKALIGELCRGETVTDVNGKEVHPDDILMPLENTNAFVVLDCPDEGFLDDLLSAKLLLDLGPGKEGVSLMVHMTPAEIVCLPRYQEFIKRYGEETNHLFMNENCSSEVLTTPYKLQTQLNLIDQISFPLLPDTEQGQTYPILGLENSRVVQAICGIRFTLRPTEGFSKSMCYERVKRSVFVEEAKEIPGFQNEIVALSEILLKYPTGEADYPEIVFLGTGSSCPNLHRNVTCIVIHASPTNSFLLDCGEDSIGQLYRHYGNQTEEILRNLKGVFISHRHADHHMGLTSIVLCRKKAREEAGLEYTRLYVMSPVQLTNRFTEIRQHLYVIPCQKVVPSLDTNYEGLFRELLKTAEMTQVIPVEVEHCMHAYGVVLEHKSGWKIAYSGDTMPCANLVEKGKGCDLLIHEATFQDELIEEAEGRKHSTFSQAINIGVQMEAKFTVLTHFSQRYPKIPLFNQNFSSKVGVAFDNMRIKLSHCDRLPLHRPALQALFREELMLLETRYNEQDEAGNQTFRRKKKEAKKNSAS